MSRAPEAVKQPNYGASLSDEEKWRADVTYSHSKILEKIAKNITINLDEQELIAPFTEENLRLFMQTPIDSELFSQQIEPFFKNPSIGLLYSIALHYFAGHELHTVETFEAMQALYRENLLRSKKILQLIYERNPYPAATYHYARSLRICGAPVEKANAINVLKDAEKQGSIAATLVLYPENRGCLDIVKKAALLESDPIAYVELVTSYLRPVDEAGFEEICGTLLSAADLGHSQACAELHNLYYQTAVGKELNKEYRKKIDISAAKAAVLDHASASACYKQPFASLGLSVQIFLSERFKIPPMWAPAFLFRPYAAIADPIRELSDQELHILSEAQKIRFNFCRMLLNSVTGVEDTSALESSPILKVLSERYSPLLVPFIKASTETEMDKAIQKIKIENEVDCKILFALAMNYVSGDLSNVKTDDLKAFKLFTFLDALLLFRFPAATHQLSQCYFNGIGVKKDERLHAEYSANALHLGSYAAKADHYFLIENSRACLAPLLYPGEIKLLQMAALLENSGAAWSILADYHYRSAQGANVESEFMAYFSDLEMAAKTGLFIALQELYVIHNALVETFCKDNTAVQERATKLLKIMQERDPENIELGATLTRKTTEFLLSKKNTQLFAYLAHNKYPSPTKPTVAPPSLPANRRRKKPGTAPPASTPTQTEVDAANAAAKELLAAEEREQKNAAAALEAKKATNKKKKVGATKAKNKTVAKKKADTVTEPEPKPVSAPRKPPAADQGSVGSDYSSGGGSAETPMSAISAKNVIPAPVASELDPIQQAMKKLQASYSDKTLEPAIKKQFREVAHEISAFIDCIQRGQSIPEQFTFKALPEKFEKAAEFAKTWNAALYELYSECKKNKKYKPLSDALEKAYPDLSWRDLVEKCTTDLKSDPHLSWRALAEKCIADLETLVAHSRDAEKNAERRAVLQHMKTALGRVFSTEHGGGGGGGGEAGHSDEIQSEKAAFSAEQKRIYENWNHALNQFALLLPDSELKLALSAYYLHAIENDEIRNIFFVLKNILAADMACMQGSSILYDQIKNIETEVKPDYDFCIYLGTEEIVLKGIKRQLEIQFPDYKIESETLSADFASFTLQPKASPSSLRKIDLSFYRGTNKETCKKNQLITISEAFVPLSACYLEPTGQLSLRHQDMKNYLAGKIVFDVHPEYLTAHSSIPNDCENALAYLLKMLYRFRTAISEGLITLSAPAREEQAKLQAAITQSTATTPGTHTLYEKAVERALKKYSVFLKPRTPAPDSCCVSDETKPSGTHPAA